MLSPAPNVSPPYDFGLSRPDNLLKVEAPRTILCNLNGFVDTHSKGYVGLLAIIHVFSIYANSRVLGTLLTGANPYKSS